MANRTLLGAVLLMAGTFCVGVAVIAAAWIDTAYAHESTAVNQAALQAALQGRTLSQWMPPAGILSSTVIWSAFGAGGTLMLAGLVVGLRSLPAQA